VVILGETGFNFAAGMSGGIAYVLNEQDNFETRCNKALVGLDELEDGDIKELKSLISDHYKFTKSKKAKAILDEFDTFRDKFIKVIPHDFKRVMEAKENNNKKNVA
jgi:glutamate synthase (NADPH/NADH) large chain